MVDQRLLYARNLPYSPSLEFLSFKRGESKKDKIKVIFPQMFLRGETSTKFFPTFFHIFFNVSRCKFFFFRYNLLTFYKTTNTILGVFIFLSTCGLVFFLCRSGIKNRKESNRICILECQRMCTVRDEKFHRDFTLENN